MMPGTPVGVLKCPLGRPELKRSCNSLKDHLTPTSSLHQGLLAPGSLEFTEGLLEVLVAHVDSL